VRTSGSEASQRYPAAVIVMHWAIAAAVVGLMVLGWWMQTILSSRSGRAPLIASINS